MPANRIGQEIKRGSVVTWKTRWGIFKLGVVFSVDPTTAQVQTKNFKKYSTTEKRIAYQKVSIKNLIVLPHSMLTVNDELRACKECNTFITVI